MGNALSSTQKAAASKFVGPTAVPADEIQNTICGLLAQVNWRDVDLTLPECRGAADALIAHCGETQHIAHLLAHVAKQLDGISSSATSGSLAATSGTTGSAKEKSARVGAAAQLVRLASVLLFGVVQNCAGNPFALLRLTNSSNESAMTLLGAAAELIIRVPFSPLTAALIAETTELVRFAFTTRLYGASLAAATADHGSGVAYFTSGSGPANATTSAVPLGGDTKKGNNNNNNSGNSNSGDDAVLDPFLRRLALGQCDALLTRALVHALLQRVGAWAAVLRGKTRSTVWMPHQRATLTATITAPAAASEPPPLPPLLAATTTSAATAVQPLHPPALARPPAVAGGAASTAATSAGTGWGSRMFNWVFGGANAADSPTQQRGGAGGASPDGDHSPYPAAGLTATTSAAEVVAGAASLHVLLSLLLFERGSGHRARNTAVDVLRQLRGGGGGGGAAGGNVAATASSSASASSDTNSSSGSGSNGGEWPLDLVEAIATLVPSHLEAVLLLYCLLNDCPGFARAVAAAANHSIHVQLAHLVVDVLRYAVERPSSPESLFAAIVVSMLARIDAVARCMFSERLRAVPAYFERESHHVSTSLSVGAFATLAIVKVVFSSSMADGQASIGSAWLSALVNLSPFAVSLATAVEQKLVSLFTALLRRVSRLRAEVRASETAFQAAAQLDVAYAHLDVLGTAVFQMVADPHRNPTLLYELLYNKAKLTAVTSTWTPGDRLWRQLRPIMFLLDKIESELSSSSAQRSIADILEIIRCIGRLAPENRVRITYDADAADAAAAAASAAGATSNAAAIDGSDDQQHHQLQLHHLHQPRITIVGADDEIAFASFDFEEDSVLGGGGGSPTSASPSSGGGSSSVCEAFFATLLWQSVLRTDARIEPPGCLRHGALGVARGESYPIFRGRS